MKLIFPNYRLPENAQYSNYGQVVSKTQLEFVIQQANKAGASLKIMRDADLDNMQKIKHQFETDLLVDLSKMN